MNGMAEYISRETVLKKLQMQLLDLEADQDKGEYSELCENRGARDALDGAIYDIRTLKPADVQPVKRGKWDFQGYQLFKCTNCKEMFTQDQLEAMQNHKDCEECAFPNFCPNCGARMDLGDEKT